MVFLLKDATFKSMFISSLEGQKYTLVEHFLTTNFEDSKESGALIKEFKEMTDTIKEF